MVFLNLNVTKIIFCTCTGFPIFGLLYHQLKEKISEPVEESASNLDMFMGL